MKNSKETALKTIIVSTEKEVPKTHSLGRLLVHQCPRCKVDLFARHETDTVENGFSLAKDFNYCRKCGQKLDLDEFKRTSPLNDEVEFTD